MKHQQHKNVLDYQRRRHLLLSLAHRQNASNLRRFSDALSLISKVFGEYVVMCRYLESRIPSTQHQHINTLHTCLYMDIDIRHQMLDIIQYKLNRNQTLDIRQYILHRYQTIYTTQTLDIRHQTVDIRHQKLDIRNHILHRHQTFHNIRYIDIRHQNSKICKQRYQTFRQYTLYTITTQTLDIKQ